MMNHRRLALFALAASFFVLSCTTLVSEKTEDGDWITLFDGSSLDGWRAYNGERLPPGWKIVDGELAFSKDFISEAERDYQGSRDIIYAAREFDNFELYLEWKIPPGGNSGIFYHVVEGYKSIPQVAPEYQLIDDENYAKIHSLERYNRSLGITENPEKLQPMQSTGADYGMYVPQVEEKRLNPAGEWNSSRIVFTPDRAEHWLNGQLLLTFDPWSEDWMRKKNEGKWGLAENYGKYKSGYIGLQDHGSPLWFRNIRIKPL